MSYAKIRRTKLLDLNWVRQMRSLWALEVEHESKLRNSPSVNSYHETPVEDNNTEHQQQLASKSSMSHHYKNKQAKGSQFSSASLSTKVYKWMPASLYRPIRYDDSGTRPKRKIPFICGWFVIGTTILISSIFIVLWFMISDWLRCRDVLLILTFAIVFEFVRSWLVVLILSLYTVYYQDRSNLEITFLDLTGLRNEARISNHARFMAALMKPYYHPLTAEKIQERYKKKKKTLMYFKFFGFIFVICGMVLPALLLAVSDETYSMYRIGKWSKDVLRDPLTESPTGRSVPFKDVRTIDDLTVDYFYVAVAPATRVITWYNKKLMKPKTIVPLQFQHLDIPILKKSYGQFDSSMKYKISYNRWNQIAKKEESNVGLDKLLSNGITGTTNMFYPASIGDVIRLQKSLRYKDEGIQQAKKHMKRKQTRAIIIEITLAHPSYSRSYFGYSVITMLFENLASGIYTGSMRVSVFHSQLGRQYLMLGCILCGIFLLCIIPIILMLIQDGLRANLKNLLFWVMIWETVFCFFAAITNFGLYAFIRAQEQEQGQVWFHDIVWLSGLADVGLGFFSFCVAITWIVWWSELTGLIRNIESSLIRLFAAHSIYLLGIFSIGALYDGQIDHRILVLDRIDKNPIHVHITELVTCIFISATRFLLWPFQVGVVVYITGDHMEYVHIRFRPKDKMMNVKHVMTHSRAARSAAAWRKPGSGQTWTHDDDEDGDLKQATSSTIHLSATERLERKFSLWN